MTSLNKVMIMGRLGQDPEMRYTQNQIAVCTLNVATSEFRTGSDGQRSESTEWHRVVVWRNQAENCGKYLSKGSAVFIEGKLQTRSWEDQSGQKRYTTEIVANNVQFLPSGRTNSTSQNIPQEMVGSELPKADATPPNGFGGAETSSMDDIPF